jgi:Flp pilus assembly protein TadD
VAVIFGAALGHPFLASHDDGPYIVANPVIRAPPLAAIRGAFTTHPLGAWAPLHLLSHAADHAVFGDWAGGWVLVNLALHTLNACLLAYLVRRLGARPIAAFATGVLFAVHPVQVEAVVWISQRKTVLSLAFTLAALHLWIRYARATPERRFTPWALTLLAGAAALLTKAVAVVLPLALIALDVPLRRIRASWGWVLEKVPMAAAAAALAWITVLMKDEVGADVTVEGHTRTAAGGFAWHGGSPLGTFYTMATVLPRYLRLLVWPHDLSAVYLPPVHARLDAEVVASLVLLALLAAAGVALARRAPRLFCWYALFFLGLLPVAQIVPQVTLMNDRYLYVPMVGFAALSGELLAAALARSGGWAFAWPRRAVAAIAVVASLALALQARARVPVWRSDLALWSDATAKAPRSPYAWFNLGRAQELAGNEEEALASYRQACDLDARDGDAALNAGAIYLRRGALEEGAVFVERGARLLPRSGEAQFNLALLRFRQGKLDEAERALRRALECGAERCATVALLGHALALTGRSAEALQQYGEAVAQGCDDPELALYRAFALSERGDLQDAFGTLSRAVPAAARLGPTFLDRETLKPLRAHPRFEALLRRYAAYEASQVQGSR